VSLSSEESVCHNMPDRKNAREEGSVWDTHKVKHIYCRDSKKGNGSSSSRTGEGNKKHRKAEGKHRHVRWSLRWRDWKPTVSRECHPVEWEKEWEGYGWIWRTKKEEFIFHQVVLRWVTWEALLANFFAVNLT